MNHSSLKVISNPTRSDVIVVGSGLSGLYSALLASRQARVLLLTKARLEESNTYHAQGGIAAALAAPDSPELHFRDTIAAGAGLCDPTAVRVLVEEGPRRVRDLIERGVRFDLENGEIALTREGAHSRPRVLHAGGDATGASIETTIATRVRSSPNVTILENHLVSELLIENSRVSGVRALDCNSGEEVAFASPAVILATGGAGQLFSQTTNPAVATGDGIALAFRAGAEIGDIEFVQFHPTALAVPGAPRFLISEAVRGEGGILRNSSGERFMLRIDPRAELAPRDVVARGILFEMERTGDRCAFLDVTHLDPEHFRRRFPTISGVCRQFGIDPAREPIPVAPAAHYLMGGIRTDVWGATSVAGLFACGECACTGVHGANRLASNSLLETIVFAARVVQKLCGETSESAGPAQPPREGSSLLHPDLRISVPKPSAGPSLPRSTATLRELTWSLAGLVRTAPGLQRLESIASAWLTTDAGDRNREAIELRSLTILARLLALAALRREESRGAHFRRDFPLTDPAWQRRIILVQDPGGSAPEN